MSSGGDRERIVDSAKYLRGVRPLDPEELAEYVDGGAHPAVVGRVLREAAFDLGIVEREDGTFVPVGEDPVPPGIGTVRRVPESYVRRVEDRLFERYGPDWYEGGSGDRLRGVIRRLKEDYYRNRDVEYDADVALGYSVYHLGDFYAAVQYVLEELAAAGLLDRQLRVLDVGAGVGGPALGLHDFLYGPPADRDDPREGGSDEDAPRAATDRDRDRRSALVDYHAVEPSVAADVLGSVLEETTPNFRTTVHRETAEAFDPGGEFDLVVFANVLNELEAPTAVARRYFDSLAPDGSLLAMAPADRETSIGLRTVERDLESAGATVFSPEVRLWPDRTPGDQGWSFDERTPIDVPSLQSQLDGAGGDDGEFRKTEVRYSYSVLRRDGKQRLAFVPDRGRFAPLANSEEFVTERVNLVGIKLSRDLAEGENPLFRVGDGSQLTDHYAVLTRESALNRDLAAAAYGEVLVFESVLVLWNDDEEAYNLVVDEETVVDRLVA